MNVVSSTIKVGKITALFYAIQYYTIDTLFNVLLFNVKNIDLHKKYYPSKIKIPFLFFADQISYKIFRRQRASHFLQKK